MLAVSDRPRKTQILGIRMSADTLDALRAAAEQERRQVSVLAQMILGDWLRSRAQYEAQARATVAMQSKAETDVPQPAPPPQAAPQTPPASPKPAARAAKPPPSPKGMFE